MAALGLFSLAMFLQVLAGLVPILYEDLNPENRGSEGRVQVLNVPKAASLVLLITRGAYEDRGLEEALDEALSRSEGTHVQRSPAPQFRDLEYRASDRRGLFGAGPGLLHRWYTRPATILEIRDVQGLDLGRQVPSISQLPVRETRIYSGLPRPFGRQDWELAAYRKIWQRSSLLLVGIAALVRFAYGEPILRLF